MARTTDPNELVQGEQPSLQPGAEQDYRVLEHSYRQSAAYAEMVQRYAVLRSTIAACRGHSLVGHPTRLPWSEQQPRVVLQWERSHGEAMQ
jgi:hypothetical protein